MVIWGVEDIDQTSIPNGVDVLAGGIEHSRLAVDDRTTFASLVDHIASSGEVIIAWAGIVTPVVTIVGVLTGASRTAVRLPRLTLKVSLSLEDADIPSSWLNDRILTNAAVFSAVVGSPLSVSCAD